MKPHVLLLIPSTTYRTSAFMQAALNLNLEVVVGTDKKQTLASKAPEANLTLPFQNPEKAVKEILEFAKSHPFQAIVGVDDDTVILATMASQASGLVHNTVESVRLTRNKFLFRQALASTNLPAPHFQLFNTQGPPSTIAQQVSYPCVIKPTFLSGSRGVIRVNSPEQFVDAFQEVVELLSDTEVQKKGGDASNELLVEDYIPGQEVALEGVLIRGKLKLLALFDKPDPLEGPLFIETIYVTPSCLPHHQQQAILQTVQRSADALGLREGPIHAELRCNEQGVWPIEIAARSIGGLCSRVFEFSGKLSLEELILHHALGANIETIHRLDSAAGVMMLPIPQQGVLKAVNHQDCAKSVSGIQDLVISIPLGQEVIPLPKGDQYLGFIFAKGESPEKVEQSLREAYAALEIEIGE